MTYRYIALTRDAHGCAWWRGNNAVGLLMYIVTHPGCKQCTLWHADGRILVAW